MLRYIAIVLSTFLLLSMSSQQGIKEFYPEMMGYVDIQNENLITYERFEHLIDSVITLGLSLDEIDENIRSEINTFSMSNRSGPYITQPVGCSWYCAGWPNVPTTTSELKPQAGNTYIAKNLHDYDVRTAWVEGVEGCGENEEIQFTFNMYPNLKVTTIEIFNGYCKDVETWKKNGRVKELQLSVDDTIIGILHCKDTYMGQSFEIGEFHCKSKEDTMTFKLTILSTYPGDKYDDTAISEINFDGKGDH